MSDPIAVHPEVRLAGAHMAVSGIGFGVDFVVLHLALYLGMEPAWARVISLGLAMQATFVLNGILVFRCLHPDRRIARQWAGYMAANAFGNLCNYWIFVTLVSTHWQGLSLPTVALCLASLVAWAINYGATRLVVFAGPLARLAGQVRAAKDCPPSLEPGRVPKPAAPGSVRP